MLCEPDDKLFVNKGVERAFIYSFFFMLLSTVINFPTLEYFHLSINYYISILKTIISDS